MSTELDRLRAREERRQKARRDILEVMDEIALLGTSDFASYRQGVQLALDVFAHADAEPPEQEPPVDPVVVDNPATGELHIRGTEKLPPRKDQ